MLVKMIHPLHQPVLSCSTQTYKVESLQVWHHVTKTNSSSVGTHWDPELGCHQVDSQHLIDPGHAGRVNLDSSDEDSGKITLETNLAELHPTRHEELLEHHPVLATLPCSHPHTKVSDTLA